MYRGKSTYATRLEMADEAFHEATQSAVRNPKAVSRQELERLAGSTVSELTSHKYLHQELSGSNLDEGLYCWGTSGGQEKGVWGWSGSC